MPMREALRTREPEAVNRGNAPAWLSLCLPLLLAYCTASVFITSAWAIQSFQLGVFALVAVYLLTDVYSHRALPRLGTPASLIYLTPLWGIFQIVAHSTSSTFDTRLATLRWGALAGVLFLSQVCGRMRAARRILLSLFLCFATAMAVLCLTQLFTSEGKVLWLIPTGYPDVYATFPSYNSYAQFIELALPVALWRALREGWRSWWYGLSGALLYASVIGAASRAGATLCTAELLAVLLIGLLTLRDPKTGVTTRSTTAVLIMVPMLAAVFTLAVGWERVWQRFQQNDPYLIRREFIVAAVDMARQRPLTGFGLGTFPSVYQGYAIKDFPFYANHAHCDWAEFAADGGVPFLLLVAVPCLFVIPATLRNPWGLGVLAVVLHACVDFPFPRPAVSGWLFAMLGLLYTVPIQMRIPSPAASPRMPASARRG